MTAKENYYEFCGYSNEIIKAIASATKCQIEISGFKLNEKGNKFDYSKQWIDLLINVSLN